MSLPSLQSLDVKARRRGSGGIRVNPASATNAAILMSIILPSSDSSAVLESIQSDIGKRLLRELRLLFIRLARGPSLHESQVETLSAMAGSVLPSMNAYSSTLLAGRFDYQVAYLTFSRLVHCIETTRKEEVGSDIAAALSSNACEDVDGLVDAFVRRVEFYALLGNAEDDAIPVHEEDDPTPEERLNAKRERGDGTSTDPAPNEPDSSELEANPTKRAQRESDPLLGVLTASAPPRLTHLLVEIRDGGYMPPIGSVPGFVAEPNTVLQPGNVLAVVAPMGCGKSTIVTQYLYDNLNKEPLTRILYLTANRMSATSAAVELRELVKCQRDQGNNTLTIGSYMEKKVDLAACQICLCSLESLHKVKSLRYDLIVAYEASSIARLIGGGTLPGYDNVYLLRDLCSYLGTRVLALDADTNFKMVDSQPTTIVDDFLQCICPGRPVVWTSELLYSPPPPLDRCIRSYTLVDF